MKPNIFGDVNVSSPPRYLDVSISGISRSLDPAESTTVSAPCIFLLSANFPYDVYAAEMVGGRGGRGNGWDPRRRCAPQAGIVRLRLQGKKIPTGTHTPVLPLCRP